MFARAEMAALVLKFSIGVEASYEAPFDKVMFAPKARSAPNANFVFIKYGPVEDNFFWRLTGCGKSAAHGLNFSHSVGAGLKQV